MAFHTLIETSPSKGLYICVSLINFLSKAELQIQLSWGVHANIPSVLGMNLELKGNHVVIDLKNFDDAIHKKKVLEQ